MSEPVYVKAGTDQWARPLKECGPVISTKGEDAIVFLCPCGGREVYVTSPPHQITFDEEGKLTLDGSVGSRPLSGPHEHRMVHGVSLHDLPANWCHISIKGGVAKMYDDAKCPGSQPRES